MVDYEQLDDARSEIMRRCRRERSKYKSLDTTGPSVEAALLVVEFEVVGARDFAKEVTAANMMRIRQSRRQYRVDLFTACYLSGMTTGAMAERRR
jgi:hypothetical protein